MYDQDEVREEREEVVAEGRSGEDAGEQALEDDGETPRGEGEFDGDPLAVDDEIKEGLGRLVKGFDLRPAAEIPPAPVEWLWPGRIPRRHLTLLAGDPDAG